MLCTCVCAGCCVFPPQGVEELGKLIAKAKDYYKNADDTRPPPDRLSYVHSPRNAAEAEAAKKIQRAVSDAQVPPADLGSVGVTRTVFFSWSPVTDLRLALPSPCLRCGYVGGGGGCRRGSWRRERCLGWRLRSSRSSSSSKNSSNKNNSSRSLLMTGALKLMPPLLL